MQSGLAVSSREDTSRADTSKADTSKADASKQTPAKQKSKPAPKAQPSNFCRVRGKSTCSKATSRRLVHTRVWPQLPHGWSVPLDSPWLDVMSVCCFHSKAPLALPRRRPFVTCKQRLRTRTSNSLIRPVLPHCVFAMAAQIPALFQVSRLVACGSVTGSFIAPLVGARTPLGRAGSGRDGDG